MDGTTKPDNETIYYTIDEIQTAIQEKCPISFQYFEYTQDKKKVLKHDGYRYVFSPYAMIWNRDYYYVVGWSEKHEKLAQFRVDRITAIEHLNSGYVENEAFNPATYVQEVFGMYNDDTCAVKLLCHNSTMRNIIDRFGEDVETTPVDGEHFRVTVNVAPSPPFFLGYSHSAVVFELKARIAYWKKCVRWQNGSVLKNEKYTRPSDVL